MIIETKKKNRIVEIDGKEYENVLGLYTRYKYVPKYQDPETHQVYVANTNPDEKRERIKSVIIKAEQGKRKIKKIIECYSDNHTVEEKIIEEDLEK